MGSDVEIFATRPGGADCGGCAAAAHLAPSDFSAPGILDALGFAASLQLTPATERLSATGWMIKICGETAPLSRAPRSVHRQKTKA